MHPTQPAPEPLSPARSPSRVVTSSQSGPHPKLEKRVRKHLESRFLAPIAAYSREAHARLLTTWDGRVPLVLDSACGTGESSATLARRHGEALVVGIDQSAERLERGQRKLAASARPENLLLLRADATELWALLAADGVRLSHHYLLYPNPWPKSEHLQRRWHGHPRFRELLALGGVLELRSNWRLYAEEFALALRLAGRPAEVGPVPAGDPPLTPFERKYGESGHALWQVSSRSVGAAQAGNTPVDR
ncbi:methyltransferase domain-containing protein [Aquabacterium sp. A7-Y]|uniref:tRNA (guanine(46)-N(7))-methyltransferase TrmB n=1 Tax=Aquabacterium sp. A7-Y TaxID=1349605 RepID=UPI00223E1321|nr:methyltransferase domain-containing protein [Aquabacterium sp. A7-Y]MCW7536347.1 methyltransferase domain-containing protein [Aquabacterium sp. A7-Y]